MSRKRILLSHDNQGRLALLVLAVIFWFLLFLLLTKVDPKTVSNIPFTRSYGPFFVLLVPAVLSTVWLCTKQYLRTVIWTAIVTAGFMLRLLGLGNIMNLLLLFVLLVCIEFVYRFK